MANSLIEKEKNAFKVLFAFKLSQKLEIPIRIFILKDAYVFQKSPNAKFEISSCRKPGLFNTKYFFEFINEIVGGITVNIVDVVC